MTLFSLKNINLTDKAPTKDQLMYLSSAINNYYMDVKTNQRYQ